MHHTSRGVVKRVLIDSEDKERLRSPRLREWHPSQSYLSRRFVTTTLFSLECHRGIIVACSMLPYKKPQMKKIDTPGQTDRYRT